jgi:ribosomal protein L37AE/L43A
MKEHYEKNCPECGQRLRFPKNVGGIVMACSSCGKRFHSDFKLAGTGKTKVAEAGASPGLLTVLFNLPMTMLDALRRWFFRG